VGLVADDGEAEARRDVAIEVTAGVSDTGVDADSGTFDTGPDVADVDADSADTEDVARADTGAEPPPERLEEGCGCGSSGSGRPVGGAAIVAVLLVGLLRRRRRGAIVATTTLVCLLAATGAEAQVLTRGLSIGQMGTGQEVAGVGDVDGDGFDDVLIYDGSAGEIALHRGSGSGAEATPTQTIALGSSHSSEIVLAGAGDVDGDGHADVLVGDPAIDAGQGNPTGGRVDLYYGSPTGLETPAGWTISEADSNLGLSVAGAGDLNGDGFADVVVGNPDADSCAGSGAAGGASHAYVFFGSASGLAQNSGWSTDDQSATATCLGASVAGAGDVDGDGYDDLLVGAPGYPNASKPDGRVFLYRGSASGLPTGPNWASTQPGAVGDSRYGMQVAGAGDIDGDGFADVLVAGEADFGNGLEGRFFVFGGSASGLAERPGWQRSIAAADSDAGDFAGAGDVDGDGMGDLLVWTDNDSIAMYQGSGAGVVEPAAWRLSRAGIGYGESVDGAGDVDGDGHADLVVGTEGRGAFVFRGGPNPAPSAKMKSLTIEAGQSKAVALSADDMHGDPLTYAIEAEPQHGTLSMLDADRGEVTYAADPDYEGADGFDFRVEDPFGGSDTATVSVTINVPNDPPRFVAPTPEQQVQAYAGRRLSFGVAADDPDGDPVTLSARNLPDGATFEAESGEFVWTPRQAGVTELATFVADDGTETTEREVFIGVDTPPEDVGPEADAEVADTVDAAEPEVADEESGDGGMVDASEPDERPEQTGCSAAGPAAPGYLSWAFWVVALFLARRFADR
jgi:MYXO-CTERM domain-containing protein/uncharacterized protein (TIGR03382 family)